MPLSKKEKKEKVSLYLTPALKGELKYLAESTNRSLNNVIEVLLLDAIEKEKNVAST